jgi:Tol biopolymer transport system component
MWVATRDTTDDPWNQPANLGAKINSSAIDGKMSISSDGLSLFFVSTRPGGRGGRDLWVTTRVTTDDSWDPPVNLGANINSAADDSGADISADGLVLIFASNRTGGYGDRDLWVTTQQTSERMPEGYWGTPINLGPTVNSTASDTAPYISVDGQTLYFSSDHPDGVGGHDMYQASVIPIIDLNGDGIVEAADMCIIVDHWGTDNSLCDIGPMPWGDGVVDVQDLIVLAEHLFEEFPPAQ